MTTIETTKVRLRSKDGTEFVGTPLQCARILVGDALRIYSSSGGRSQWALWEAEDFCKYWELSARNIAESKARFINDFNNPFNS